MHSYNQKKKDVLKGVIALSQDRLKYEQTRKELGASTTFETLQFQNAILSDSTSLLTQELAYDNATQNLKIAEERFKTGAINSFNYRDAQVAYLRNASSLLEAQYNALTSKTSLVRLTGGLVSDNP